MDSIYIQYHKTPVGELKIGSYNDQLCLCDWRFRKMRSSIDKRITEGLQADFKEEKTGIIQNTIDQLSAYFNNELIEFDIPLLFVGTDFQKSVWNELLTIPFGKTETYLGLSRKLHNEKAIRAVASANGSNAISIMVPCHRIIGSNRELTGYAGGLSTKKRLLQLEGFYNTPQMQLF